MKIMKAKIILFFLCCITTLQAQTVDKLRESFKENLKAQNQTTVLQFLKTGLKETLDWYKNNEYI